MGQHAVDRGGAQQHRGEMRLAKTDHRRSAQRQDAVLAVAGQFRRPLRANLDERAGGGDPGVKARTSPSVADAMTRSHG
jgi:hypothetical protein